MHPAGFTTEGRFLDHKNHGVFENYPLRLGLKPVPLLQHPETIHTGWWYTYPSEKWWSSSAGMMTFPTNGKIKNVPNISKPPTSISIHGVLSWHHRCLFARVNCCCTPPGTGWHVVLCLAAPCCAIFKWYPLVIVHSKSKYVWFRGEIKAERFHRICRIYSHMFKPAKRFSTTHHHDNCNLTRIIRKSQYRIQLIQQDDSPSFLGWYGWSKNGYTPKLPKSMTILPVKLEFWGCST